MASSLCAIKRALVREPAPFVTRCRKGKSKKVRVRRASRSSVATAFGYLAPYSPANLVIASRACFAGLGVQHLVERGLHARLETLGQLVEDVPELVVPDHEGAGRPGQTRNAEGHWATRLDRARVRQPGSFRLVAGVTILGG